MTIAYVGIGSNLDDPQAQVTCALEELAQLPHTRIVARSSLYRSAPVGFHAQPDFVNAVAALDTALDARALLAQLQAIEARHGRRRSFQDAPRTLDLDVLLYGEKKMDEPDLTVPHPRMHERAFVLQPLAELDAAVLIPGHGTAAQCLAACAGQKVQRIS